MQDLYEGRSDSFVVGMANGGSREGIFSFLRYDPEFQMKEGSKKKRNLEENRTTLLKRCCKVTVHELLHLFGVDHCTWFSCLMQGAGHLQEDFTQPLNLCPVDLHKIAFELDFNIGEYYKGMLQFIKKTNFKQSLIG